MGKEYNQDRGMHSHLSYLHIKELTNKIYSVTFICR